MTDLSISELRCDPIVGRRVLIAEDRAGRPSDYIGVHVGEVGSENCPFCVGHEQQTPDASLEVPYQGGGWQVRVIPNKYPAVRLDVADGDTEDRDSLPLPVPESPLGAHEVIVESSRHLHDVDEMTVEELAMVFRVYRDRLKHWADVSRLRHATLFKNVGFAAGASLEHVHSQLVVLPSVSPVVEAEMQSAHRYFQEHGECIFCNLLAEERRLAVRWVAEIDPFAAFCAYAGRQPYETWLLPTTHATQFHETADADLVSLAAFLQQVLLRLRQCVSPLAYNLILHTSPFGSEGSEFYHWHWELIPRTSHLAGLEWGAGVHINSLSPERAALLLQKVKL